MPHEESYNKSDLVRYRLNTAADDIKAAELLLNNQSYKAANNRAYYAIYHAISAVHALSGKAYKRHKDALGNFNRDFVRTGIFDPSFGRKISEAEKIRHASDYDDFYIAVKSDVLTQINNAKEIVSVLEAYCISQLESM